jgi:transcriptional regulator with XRE-family HTH domain
METEVSDQEELAFRVGFAQRLVTALKATNISQAQLAKQIGCAPASVSSWITGKKLPNSLQLMHLCSALGASADSLLALTPVREGRHAHEGFVWAERIPEHAALPQKQEIELGIRLFRALIVDRVGAEECTALHGPFPGRTWQELHKAFTVAVRSGALSLTQVPRATTKEEHLIELFPDLRQVIVAALPQTRDYLKYMGGIIVRTELVAFLTATRALVDSLHNGRIVGLGGGFTIMRFGELTIPSSGLLGGTQWAALTEVKNPRFEPVSSSANYAAKLLTCRHPGTVLLPLPYIPVARRAKLMTGAPPETLEEEQAVATLAQLDQPHSVAAIFMSVGGIADLADRPNSDFARPEFDPATFTSITLRQIYGGLDLAGYSREFEGEVLGYMLNAKGKLVGPEDVQAANRDAVFAIDLQLLPRIARDSLVWVIAAGGYKRRAVLMAIRCGLANSLVIDEEIADYLIENRPR